MLCAHASACRWPLAATHVQVSSLRLHPCSHAHSNNARRPCEVVHSQTGLKTWPRHLGRCCAPCWHCRTPRYWPARGCQAWPTGSHAPQAGSAAPGCAPAVQSCCVCGPSPVTSFAWEASCGQGYSGSTSKASSQLCAQGLCSFLVLTQRVGSLCPGRPDVQENVHHSPQSLRRAWPQQHGKTARMEPGVYVIASRPHLQLLVTRGLTSSSLAASSARACTRSSSSRAAAFLRSLEVPSTWWRMSAVSSRAG